MVGVAGCAALVFGGCCCWMSWALASLVFSAVFARAPVVYGLRRVVMSVRRGHQSVVSIQIWQ